MRSTSTLSDNRTGQNLVTITLHEQNAFELNPNQYSTVVAEDDAQTRSVAELNQEILVRLNLFMQRRLAAEPAKKAEAER